MPLTITTLTPACEIPEEIRTTIPRHDEIDWSKNSRSYIPQEGDDYGLFWSADDPKGVVKYLAGRAESFGFAYLSTEENDEGNVQIVYHNLDRPELLARALYQAATILDTVNDIMNGESPSDHLETLSELTVIMQEALDGKEHSALWPKIKPIFI